MTNYHVGYSYLKLVQFPSVVGAVPTFKEEQSKLN